MIEFLEDRDWYVVITHGNEFSSGLPDLYIFHLNHGQRWVELKNPAKYHFTRDQHRVFPEFTKRRVGIWVMTEASEEEYQKLFKAPNLYQYWGHTKRML